MRIAVVIQGQEEVTWQDWLALASACEQHGLPTLLRSDHYQGSASESHDGALDAWGSICALAAATSHLRLGTLVSPVTFRHPAVLSKLALTADQVSGGRIEIGLGAGWQEDEHARYGLRFPPVSERMALLERQLRVLHEHSTGDGYAPRPAQRPHPPLIVGGSGGARGISLAARWADEYNTPDLLPDEAARRRRTLAAECQRAGRAPIRFSVMLPLALGANRAKAMQHEQQIARRLGRGNSETVVGGSVDHVIDRLREYAAAGVDRVVLGHMSHRDLDTIALLGKAVVPALADDEKRS